MSAHIALNRLWHLSPRIPLTRFLLCPQNSCHDFVRRRLQLAFLLPCPPHSSDLALSDFQHFGPAKDELGGRRLADEDGLKHSVHEELQRFSTVLRYRHTASHAKVEKVF